ncbi:MAG: thiamine pyrophosphate-requiring protein [Dehalococcoidia bacterium]
MEVPQMIGFDLAARCLKAEGVEWLACFPMNPLIEAVAKIGIRPIIFRQERGGINAADGFSRQNGGTNKIGVFASQFGPGAENSFGGIAQAWGDSVPLVYMPAGPGPAKVGVAPNFATARNYAGITKLAISVDSVEQTSGQIRRAFHAVRNGRPAPVLVELHMAVAMQEVPEGATGYKPTRAIKSAPSRSDVKDAVKALLNAANPVIWAGQGVLYAGAAAELKELAELTQIPVITTMQAKSAFPDDHPLALGAANRTAPKMVWKWLGDSDTFFAIGSGLTRTTYSIDIPDGKFMIHSTVSAEDINKEYAVDIGMVGDAKLTLEMMIDEVKGELGENGRRGDTGTAGKVAEVRAEWLAEWQPLLTSDETPINPYRVISEMNNTLDHENSVVTHDAGGPRDAVMPFYRATAPHRYIGWGKTTHLGYGIPLMIGAKMADPDLFCMNVMGDLAFGHTATEIETAVRAGIPITTLILNNQTMSGYDRYMPVAMEQYGAGNQGGDYAGVARALGATAINVNEVAEIAPALKKAQEANKDGEVVVIEVRTRQDTRYSAYPDLLKP